MSLMFLLTLRVSISIKFDLDRSKLFEDISSEIDRFVRNLKFIEFQHDFLVNSTDLLLKFEILLRLVQSFDFLLSMLILINF